MSDLTLKRRFRDEMQEALRAGDKVRLGALRMLSAAVTNREKDVLHELSDDEVRDVAAKEMKRRTEAIEAFERGGRPDLVEKETAERAILQAYAPEQLSDAEVDALVEEAIVQTAATSPKELGKVMGVVMSRAKGRADGALLQAKVRERLGAS